MYPPLNKETELMAGDTLPVEPISQPTSDAVPGQAASGDVAPPVQSAPSDIVSAVETSTAASALDTSADSTPETPVTKADASAEKKTTDAKSEASTLLGGEDAKTTDKAADTKDPSTAEPDKTEPSAEGAEKNGDQSDEPASLPTYEDFTVPEGVSLDKEVIGDVTTLLGEFEIKTKADHAEVQALGQAMLERHIAEVQKTVSRLTESAEEARRAEITAWREQFEKDPDIGGNKKDTTVSEALEAIRTFGGSEAQQAEFKQLMEATGLGNHPAMIRMLKNAQQAVAHVRSLPGTRPVPEDKSKVFRRYGTY